MREILCTDETYLLLRDSGTEPLMRIYAESCSKESVARQLESARTFALGSSGTRPIHQF
jgi:phosphomannomutase